GNSSTQQNPVHTYGTAGTYNVTYVVTNDVGCSGSNTQPVTIYPVPVATAVAPPACDGTPVTFTSNSSISGGSLVNTYWSFGDGGSSNATPVSHLYSAYGTYNVTLVV